MIDMRNKTMFVWLALALALLALVGTASAALPVTDGLVAEYNFVQGEDPAVLYDISGNMLFQLVTGRVLGDVK